MPYASNKDLPDAIKDALPAEAQDIWRNAFNSALEKNKDDDQSATIAWGAVKNAGWTKEGEKWVKMTKKETHDLQDQEIFSVGKWNGDEYTEKDLDDMVKNFNELKDEVKPPLKLGHTNKRVGDGAPALGWVTNLKRLGNKLVADFKQVPELVYKAITGGGYKRISAEIYWNYKQKYNRVLAGVALLGADIPAVTNLQDLAAFYGENQEVREYIFELEKGAIMDIDALKKSYEEDVKIAQAAQVQAEEEVKKYQTRIAKMEAEKAEEQKKADIQGFLGMCEAAVKDGRMSPAQRDYLTNAIDTRTYTVDNGLSFNAEDFQGYIEKGPKILDEKEYGADTKSKEYSNMTAGEELDARVSELIATAKEPMTYNDACAEILKSDEDLAKRYMNEDVIDPTSD